MSGERRKKKRSVLPASQLLNTESLCLLMLFYTADALLRFQFGALHWQSSNNNNTRNCFLRDHPVFIQFFSFFFSLRSGILFGTAENVRQIVLLLILMMLYDVTCSSSRKA